MLAVPAVTPVTRPEAFTVAMARVLLVQVPLLTTSLSADVFPVHIDETPVIVPAFGSGDTVMVSSALTVPQRLVTE